MAENIFSEASRPFALLLRHIWRAALSVVEGPKGCPLNRAVRTTTRKT